MAIPALLQFAEYSNITSIAVVLLCFVVTTLFIFFFRLADFPRRPVSVFGLKQRRMVKVQNPFVLSLEGQTNTLYDGLQLSLSALCPSTVIVLWGPKINPFHEFILLPGSDIRSRCLHPERNLGDVAPLHTDILKYEVPGKHRIILPLPEDVSSLFLGDMPRQRYPIAVLVLISKPGCRTDGAQDSQSAYLEHSNDESGNSEHADGESEFQSDSAEEPNSIVGLISVIHLKDEIVSQDSSVIAQYVKTAGVAIYSLQPLFLSNSNIPSAQTTEHRASSNSMNLSKTTGTHRPSQHLSPQSSSGIDDPHSRVLGAESANSQTQRTHHSGGEISGKDEGVVRGTFSDADTINHSQVNSDDSSSSLTLNSATEENNIRKRLSAKGQQNEPKLEDDQTEQAASSCSSENNDNKTSTLPTFSSQMGMDVETDMPDLSDCVVCQSRPVVCVILPCRHTCVCIKCLRLLDKCLICRGPIDSYFMLTNNGEEGDIDSESEDELMEEMQQQAVNWNMTMIFERLNERLNEMFGFR